jgi:protein phosphatase 1 regulatory subunit 42
MANKTNMTYRKITLDMILNATSLTRSRSETNETYLQRVTHLHLQGQKLKKIEKLDQCTNLKVLYLYDNHIEFIENLSFAAILQYLYLQNNLIKEIPPLPTMVNLTKLFLDENEIQYVTGLDMCVKLEELHLADQRLPQFTALEFDPVCLEAFSRTLKVLEISGNRIRSLLPFSKLYRLKNLICANNHVTDISHVQNIVTLTELESADFSGNPCCKVSRYRDLVISASSDALCHLDTVRIQRHQHIAIRGLQAHRRRIGVAMPPRTSFEDEEYEEEEQPPVDEYGDDALDMLQMGMGMGEGELGMESSMVEGGGVVDDMQ